MVSRIRVNVKPCAIAGPHCSGHESKLIVVLSIIDVQLDIWMYVKVELDFIHVCVWFGPVPAGTNLCSY